MYFTRKSMSEASEAIFKEQRQLRKEKLLANPALIIGAPVGFVNVVEAKELFLQSEVPHIVARGRKGGSNVAAAICNAMLYLAGGRTL